MLRAGAKHPPPFHFACPPQDVTTTLRPLRKIIQHLFVILGCLHLAGGPHSLIQGYAWVTMLASYSQDRGIIQAAKDTFSGEKPCDLCNRIASAEELNQSGNPEPLPPAGSALASKLLQDMLPASLTTLRPPGSRALPAPSFVAPLSPWLQIHASPPVPPPRASA